MFRRLLVFSLVLLTFLIIAVLPGTAQANFPPVVSNVHSQQRPGTKLVDIEYDVEDQDGDMLIISVAVSDDGGTTFTVPAITFIEDSDIWRGNGGQGIAPGMNKKIVWDAGADVPGISGSNFRVKVTASDAGMVLIPAGCFTMGDHFNEGAQNELPVHEVCLDDFYIDAYEVTNAQYKEFVDATGRPAPGDWSGGTYPAGKGDHPVTYVDWNDATAYAAWAGKRLPTEAEWDKAARGGLVGKRYPVGDSISHDDANYDGSGTSPVGSFPPNGYGLYDVAGNAYEWCADWYDANYYSSSPKENPKGPSSGSCRVLRGGCWNNNGHGLRVASRSCYTPTGTRDYIGFRCAGDVIELSQKINGGTTRY